jgi:hypothetical protein
MILLPYFFTFIFMIKIFLRFLVLIAAMLAAIEAPLLMAAQIGTGTVVGSGALSAPINWNDVFVGSSASGTINGIRVNGRILPTLNMTISGSGVINLGNLVSTAASTGSVSIEIGTNALNGASVTARSTNAWMTNIASGSIVINSLAADGAADSYVFTSSNGTADSTYPGFTSAATLSVQVNNNTTNHTLYTSTRPQPLTGVDDFTFSIAAQPNAQTPAGDYTDLVVVTVTGNF